MRRRMYLFIICAILLGVSGLISHTHATEPKINLQALMTQRMPVLLEFGRGWCIPCKYMKPILDDMNRAYYGKALVMTVDMDANKDLVRDFRIRMMPTQVFLLPDGKEFFRNEGTLEREQIAMVFSKMGIASAPAQGAPPSPAPQAVLPPPIPGYPGGGAR